MSYYFKSKNELSKSKNELSKIGADAFAVLDGFSSGNKSKPSSSSDPPTQTPKNLFYHQYQPEPTYMVQREVYVASVQTMRAETVVDCYEAAKMYGGTLIVDYSKRKPARRGFFYR